MTPSLTENPHLELVEAAFGPLRPCAGFIPPDIDFLVLLFTNRCGSNYLAQLLAATGRFNEAGEFFNGDTIVTHARAHGITTIADYITLLPTLIGRRDRITVKLAVEHLALLSRAGVLPALLPRMRFILLERRDRLAQAISRVIASQTLRWTTEHPARLTDAQLTYSRPRIDEELARTELGNRLLFRFVHENALAPLHFHYEKLIAAPQAHLDELSAWLPMPGLTFQPALIRIRRQANAVNQQWRDRYLSSANS